MTNENNTVDISKNCTNIIDDNISGISSQKGFIRRWLPSFNLNILNSSKSFCCRRNNSTFIIEVPLRKDMMNIFEDQLLNDRTVKTNPSLNDRRRTLLIKKNTKDENFGFTIQSYLLKRDGSDEVEPITYIDSVRKSSPASRAGLIAGDVIVAINGKIVIDYTHDQLKDLITSLTQMRVIVVFENMQKRIDLSKRQIELEHILESKLGELDQLEIEEKNIYLNATEKRFNFSKSQISMSSNGSSSKDSAIGGSVKSDLISNTCTSISSNNSISSYQKITIPSATREVCYNSKISLEGESDESNVKGLSTRFASSFFIYQHQKIPSSIRLALLSTSVHHMSPKKLSQEPDGILNKCKKSFEMNFPTMYAFQKHLFDGCKSCVSDLKMYNNLRKRQKNNEKSLEDFDKKELECLIKTSSDRTKLYLIAFVAVLPLTIYPLALAIVFLPRISVTHHFWTKKNYKNFFSINVALKYNLHYDSLLSGIKIKESSNLPLKFCEINKDLINIPKLEEMDFEQRFNLSLFHQVSLFNAINNLKEKSFLIYCLDNKLREELNLNVDKMNEEEVIMQLYMRKIYFENTDNVEVLKKKLKEWLKYSGNFYIKGHESFLLYAPIIEKGSSC
ncbi:PDZ domain and LETM1-like domain-containing protein [Strongyloides ratti]|uniref:PDZ domain and LETM1-like domain-containing protein n=1 Tax=Strongyloides ratti TaxID=34506 RepID=A0A090LI79_STRRB|nr:PDZ domain and LETM1-like domain-containing protein [Strongyloides ratti]CEF67180.1 PDZ domain and LETM1-like domain-containing protein [Strongyloides ratti]